MSISNTSPAVWGKATRELHRKQTIRISIPEAYSAIARVLQQEEWKPGKRPMVEMAKLICRELGFKD